jgi:hypothetical protein
VDHVHAVIRLLMVLLAIMCWEPWRYGWSASLTPHTRPGPARSVFCLLSSVPTTLSLTAPRWEVTTACFRALALASSCTDPKNDNKTLSRPKSRVVAVLFRIQKDTFSDLGSKTDYFHVLRQECCNSTAKYTTFSCYSIS